jgi:hypothetical protein
MKPEALKQRLDKNHLMITEDLKKVEPLKRSLGAFFSIAILMSNL